MPIVKYIIFNLNNELMLRSFAQILLMSKYEDQKFSVSKIFSVSLEQTLHSPW